MKHISTTQFVPTCAPDVTITLRKMSHGRRLELRKAIAEALATEADIVRERGALIDEIERAENAAKLEPCACTHSKELHDQNTLQCKERGCECRRPKPENNAYERTVELNRMQAELVNDQIVPAYLRWGVAKIDGLEIDGQVADVEILLASGFEDMTGEVFEELRRLSALTSSETVAFKLPTTSGAAVDGQSQNLSAPPVDETATTPLAVA